MSEIFLSDKVIENSIEAYLPHVTVKSQIIYIVVILTLILALASLPFIYVNVNIQSSGIIRPIAEKTEIKTLVAGRIDQILVRNGQYVTKGLPLAILDNDRINSQLRLNQFRLKEKKQQIFDLSILVELSKNDYDSIPKLRSALYRQQYSQFIFNLSDNLTTQKKLLRDLNIKKELYNNGKVIALQKLEDQKYEYHKAKTAFDMAFEQQLSTWQGALTTARMELNQLQAEQHQLQEQKTLNTIKAPISGTLQQFQGRYAGNYIQAGDVLGIISPDSGLIAECYVKPSDIGLIKKNMPVRFQVDAFNYNQWGLLKGSVIEIPNDFITVNNTPVFLVRCKLDQNFLTLKNGYKGKLKKGMTLHGRFVIAKRSLYELLYDKMDDWLNPQTAG